VRGYFGIGIEHTKTEVNVGTLWRSATAFGADFIFTIGRRYQKQPSDTQKSWKGIPLFHFTDFDDFRAHIPFDCRLVGVEIDPRAHDLTNFVHPERCIYLLGAEDNGLSKQAMQHCKTLIEIPASFCLNVSVAGSIVMYDRIVKSKEMVIAC
jgi:tRNA G18 (ribose-2'-O)-methylase SpoU